MGHQLMAGMGVLLLHGFSGSPSEMTPLADELGAEGYTVSVVRLAGHDTSPEDLARVTWHDWEASARESYAQLRGRTRKVALVGLSMGGALALYLAASLPAEAVVAISTPIRIRPLFVYASRIASRVMPVVPMPLRLPIRDPEVRKYRSPYRRMAVIAARQVEALLAETRRVLPHLRAPLLVVQGRKDWLIPRNSAQEILRLASGSVAAVVWLQRSGHVATLDQDRAVLAHEVIRFLRTHLGRDQGDPPR